jgi:hypothetical protein
MPSERNAINDWHRLFGLSWIDFFQDSPIDVETEIDLSLKQQFIDLIREIVTPIGPFIRPAYHALKTGTYWRNSNGDYSRT